MAAAASTVEQYLTKQIKEWKDEPSKQTYEKVLRVTLDKKSTADSLIKQHLTNLKDASTDVTNKTMYARVIADILNKGDSDKKAINNEQRIDMYVWYKIILGIPLAKKSIFGIDIIGEIKRDAHEKALKDPKLTPAQCQKHYIEFIIKILSDEKHAALVNKIFDADQKKRLKESEQPKKGLFSFGKSTPKPTTPKAATQGSTASAAAAKDPMLFTTASQTAAGASSAAAPAQAQDAAPKGDAYKN